MNAIIFWDGEAVDTTKSGAINSHGGIVLTAYIREIGKYVFHRSNNNCGRKGFSFGDDKRLPSEIRNRLSFKY